MASISDSIPLPKSKKELNSNLIRLENKNTLLKDIKIQIIEDKISASSYQTVVEDDLIRQIKEAIRRGADIGVG